MDIQLKTMAQTNNQQQTMNLVKDQEIATLKARLRALEFKNGELKEEIGLLRSANQELEQFTYMASHDLKSPLRTITCYAQLLQRRYGNQMDKEASEFLDYISNSAINMFSIIKGILSYSKVSEQASLFETTDLNTLVEEVKASLCQEIEDTAARIEFRNLPTLFISKPGMMQLFQNLISNSIKFRGTESPVITIEASLEGDYCHFKVSDNGLGMENGYQDKAFQAFQRINHLDRPGTGMGLAICKKVVVLHGGEISYHSTLGEGTTFFFSIAIAD